MAKKLSHSSDDDDAGECLTFSFFFSFCIFIMLYYVGALEFLVYNVTRLREKFSTPMYRFNLIDFLQNFIFKCQMYKNI